MARKRVNDEGGGPTWLDTYADMVTLVLTFFVLLFSMSSIDSQKWTELVKAFNGASPNPGQIIVPPNPDVTSGDGLLPPNGTDDGFGDVSVNPGIGNVEDVKNFGDLYYYLKNYVSSNNLEGDIDVSRGDGYTFITFRNNIFFAPNSSVLRAEGKPVLRDLSTALKNIWGDIGKVNCEGHTAHIGDPLTPSASKQDWKLSSDRAIEVVSYIQECLVLNPQEYAAKLSGTGNGENKPIIPHDAREATAVKNRRVELIIMKKGESLKSLEDIYKEIYGDEYQPAASAPSPAADASNDNP